MFTHQQYYQSHSASSVERIGTSLYTHQKEIHIIHTILVTQRVCNCDGSKFPGARGDGAGGGGGDDLGRRQAAKRSFDGDGLGQHQMEKRSFNSDGLGLRRMGMRSNSSDILGLRRMGKRAHSSRFLGIRRMGECSYSSDFHGHRRAAKCSLDDGLRRRLASLHLMKRQLQRTPEPSCGGGGRCYS